jgi:hypothetical protein
VWYPATLQNLMATGGPNNFSNVNANALLNFYGLPAVPGNVLAPKRVAIAAHIGVRLQQL